LADRAEHVPRRNVLGHRGPNIRASMQVDELEPKLRPRLAEVGINHQGQSLVGVREPRLRDFRCDALGIACALVESREDALAPARRERVWREHGQRRVLLDLSPGHVVRVELNL
jgi:hypothetical protein